MFYFQEPIIFGRGDQCAFFKPLVDQFGKGPLKAINPDHERWRSCLWSCLSGAIILFYFILFYLPSFSTAEGLPASKKNSITYYGTVQ